MGVLQFENKDYLTAKNSLLRVLELDTRFEFVEVNTRLGDIVFREEREFSKSKQYYTLCLEEEPERAELWIRAGKCEEKMRNFEEAITCYKQATKFSPDMAIAHLRLGWGYIRQNQKAAGI